MKKIIIKSKITFLLLIMSCNKHPQIYFDINKQEILECSGYRLKNIYIENDSVDSKGFLVEQPIQLEFKDKEGKAPYNILINQISDFYEIYKDKKRMDKFILMNNSIYTISHAVSGKKISSIKIWTDQEGKIYKTNRSNCDK